VEPHLVLFYEYVDDIVDRRAPHREAHLARFRETDTVVMAGALGDPPSGALIVFRGAAPEEVEAFALNDPYVLAGLVTGWRVERWSVV
jgi:uncharacterized protein YciI